MTDNTKKQSFVLVTALIVFTAILPKHDPFAHGWAVLIGGTVGTAFLIFLTCAVVSTGYRSIRARILPPESQYCPARNELHMDEVLIAVCVTLLVVSAVAFMQQAGIFQALREFPADG